MDQRLSIVVEEQWRRWEEGVRVKEVRKRKM
jgi:hypothetical protein